MENDKNLNQDLESDSRDTSPEDRKLGRAPLSVSEGDVSESHASNGIEVKPVEHTMEDYFLRYSMSLRCLALRSSSLLRLAVFVSDNSSVP